MINDLIGKYLKVDLIVENVNRAKQELAFLKKSERLGKITDAGRRKKEKLEGYLISKGVYEF